MDEQIVDCVNTLESPDLKTSANTSLRVFANGTIKSALLGLGIQERDLILALARFNEGFTTKRIITIMTLGFTNVGAKYQTDVDFKTIAPKSAQAVDINNLPVKNVGNLGVAGNEFGKTYMEKVKEAFYRIVDGEAKYDSNVSLRNISEMTVRYEKTMASLEELKANGVNLITTTRHENCSKRCEKWQGGHYTLDNTYQVVDGIQFIPLSVATDQWVKTKSGKMYKNGHLTGYNCRHKAIPYQKGYESPMVDKATVEKQRAIDKRMRELERIIRHWKELELMYKNTHFEKEYKNAKMKVREWKQAYINFCRKNKRAIEVSRIEIF